MPFSVSSLDQSWETRDAQQKAVKVSPLKDATRAERVLRPCLKLEIEGISASARREL